MSVPELPEVETIKESLKDKITGCTVERVEIVDHKLVKRPPVEEFVERVSGSTITGVGRRGKYLLVHLDGYVLICHLRMTGQFIYQEGKSPREHIRAVFYLEGGRRLLFCDVRRLGTFDLVPEETAFKMPPLSALGAEPLELSAEELGRILRRRSGQIKPLLLNQSVIAGLGNIYVNEILFRSKISPARKVNTLTDTDIDRLHRAICVVITEAVKSGGTTISDYIDSEGRKGRFQEKLQVYGREGKECPRCGHTIVREVTAGRSSYFCPRCQV